MACALLGAGSPSASAQELESQGSGPRIEITPAQVGAGAQISWGMCPCFRWVVQVQGATGAVETREWLISSDSIFNFREEQTLGFQRYAVRMFTVGAIEALWKSGHVGLGFTGVSWGEDRDLGYSDLLRTGLYVLVNLIRTESLRLDIHSGAEFEQLRINLGPTLQRGLIEQAAVLRWEAGGFSAKMTGFFRQDSSHLFNARYLNFGGSAAVLGRIARFDDLALALGFGLSAEHDGFRNVLGMAPDSVSAVLMMDLSYVVGGAP
jgi:hypothetical protein